MTAEIKKSLGEWEDDPPRPVKRMNETVSAWCFTFEAFLVQDDGVVLWRLCQAEELTAETEERNRSTNSAAHSITNKVFLFFPSSG